MLPLKPQQAIRVGTIVRLKRYPKGLTDLSGLPVIDPEVLLRATWPVCSLHSGVAISFHGAGFVNSAGRPIPGYSGDQDEFDVVGYQEPELCVHAQPVLSQLLGQSQQSIVSFTENGWPGDGPSVFLKDVPEGRFRSVAMNPTAPLEFYKETDPHYLWNGIMCHPCGDSIAWPYEK